MAVLWSPKPAAAEVRWMDLFLTADQQGRYYFEKGDYETAAERFQDPYWKGIAQYRHQDFEAALDSFAMVGTAEGYFYLGNCYSRLGSYEEAVASYDEALRRREEIPEARANRELVVALIPKPEEDNPEEGGQEPNLDPDEIKFDEKGEQGEEGEIQAMNLTDEQMAEIWMRGIQTSPADFLQRKFAIQAEGER